MYGTWGGKGSMGNKRNAWKKLAMTVAVPGVALGTLAAAAPAMASTAQPHGTPIETISGYSNGGGGNVNVQATGAFYDSGHLNLNSPGPFTAVDLKHGSLFTVHNQGANQTNVSPFSCFATSK